MLASQVIDKNDGSYAKIYEKKKLFYFNFIYIKWNHPTKINVNEVVLAWTEDTPIEWPDESDRSSLYPSGSISNQSMA